MAHSSHKDDFGARSFKKCNHCDKAGSSKDHSRRSKILSLDLCKSLTKCPERADDRSKRMSVDIDDGEFKHNVHRSKSERRGRVEEEDGIFVTKKKHGSRNRKGVDRKIGDLTGKQCIQKWGCDFDPDKIKVPWTEEEDGILIKYHAKFGNRWSKIAKKLPRRSYYDIIHRWTELNNGPVDSRVEEPIESGAKTPNARKRKCGKFPVSTRSILQNKKKSVEEESTNEPQPKSPTDSAQPSIQTDIDTASKNQQNSQNIETVFHAKTYCNDNPEEPPSKIPKVETGEYPESQHPHVDNDARRLVRTPSIRQITFEKEMSSTSVPLVTKGQVVEDELNSSSSASSDFPSSQFLNAVSPQACIFRPWQFPPWVPLNVPTTLPSTLEIVSQGSSSDAAQPSLPNLVS